MLGRQISFVKTWENFKFDSILEYWSLGTYMHANQGIQFRNKEGLLKFTVLLFQQVSCKILKINHTEKDPLLHLV